MAAMQKPVFGQPDDHPADLLNNAAAVTCFLAETAAALADPAGCGISEGAVFGLTQILTTIENTITYAAVKL